MVEIINGVKNIKKLNIGAGLSSNPIVNKKGGKIIKKRKQYAKGLKILQ